MKKSHALRKRVLALVAALFLIAVLAVPAFADDVSYVRVNGTMFLTTDDIVLADYFTLGSSYACESGSFSLYDVDGSLVTSGLTGFRVSSGDSTYTFMCYTITDWRNCLTSTDADYDTAVFTGDRYYVFDNYVIESGGALYNFIYECKSASSSVSVVPVNLTPSLVGVITGGFNGVLTGFGAGTADFFETVFLKNDGSLTTFALVGLVFLGVGLSVGIARWVIKKVGQ